MAAKKPRWVEPVVEQQLSLPGFAVAPLPFSPEVITALAGRKLVEYKLLFALFPERGDARRISPTVAYLRSLHALKGAPLASDRLHITLATLGSYSSAVPAGVVDNAIMAASRVVWRDIPVVLKEALSYPESGAFVLTCDTESNARIARLRQWLTWELRKIGLRPEPSFTPHMTMLYDAATVPNHPIEPVCWTASRFVLILSHVGLTHHEWIQAWTAGG